MPLLLRCLILVFFFAQGAAPLVHAHPEVQKDGFHFHTDTAHVFQISQGKQSEAPFMPFWVEQKFLPSSSFLPLPIANLFFPPVRAAFAAPSFTALSILFARAPPALFTFP
jgi:hypothetical protein